MKKLQLIFAILFSVLISTAAFAQNDNRGNNNEDLQRLAGSIMLNGQSMEYLRTLTDRFGGRLTGSPSYQKAADWAAAEFRAMGIKNVHMEPFTFANGWERGVVKAKMITPMEKPIHIEASGWTMSTPANGVSGEVIYINDIAEEALRSQASKLKGHIVMLNTANIYAQGFAAGIRKLNTAYPLLKELGVQAVITSDREPNNVINARGAMMGGQIPPLPVALLGLEDAQQVIRFLESNQPVKIEFQYENKITPGPIQVNNVIAEIPGTDKADEWIIIGAHLDSWDFATGAQDNGTGCAMVMEAARALMALGKAPRRTIRFALWSGEEQGLNGSEAYVRAHKAELDKCLAVLNTDNGAGHPNGWKVETREDVRTALQPISKSLTSFSGDGISMQFTYDTDHGPFFARGIPALDLWVNMEHYDDVHHKSSDTIDKVVAHNLTSGSAIVAITGYQIANQPQRFAERMDRTKVEEVLKKQGLYDILKDRGTVE